MFSRSFGMRGGIPIFVSTERMRAEDDARRERYFQEQERLRVERLAAHKRQEEARMQWEHQESIRAARLREEKKKTKKEQYTKGRQQNEDRVKEAKRDSQKKRSKVFERARNGDAAAVKKGVWEDNVDAAGGEPLAGMENDSSFLGHHAGQVDHNETLLHILAKHGDRQTVEWLLDHSAFLRRRIVQFLKFLSTRRRFRRARFFQPHRLPCCPPKRPQYSHHSIFISVSTG